MKPATMQAPRARSNSPSPRGFTLTELLVVILIVAVLPALGFMGVCKARDAADNSHCVASLRQLGVAGNTYVAEHGYYPRSGRVSDSIGDSWWFKEMEVELGFEAGTNPGEIDRAPSMPTCRKCLRDNGLLNGYSNLRTYSMNHGLHVPTRDESGQYTFPGIRSSRCTQFSRTAFFMDGRRGPSMKYWDVREMKKSAYLAFTGIFAIAAHAAEITRETPTPVKDRTGAAEIPDSHRPYLYTPTAGGIEIVNGKRRFNRPLYTSVERPHRIVALAGDRPEFLLMELLGKGSLFKLANVKIGLAGGTWLSEIEPVSATYHQGVQQYRIGEGDHAVWLDATRAQAFDGLLLRMRRSGAASAASAPLVLAMGARAVGSGFSAQEPDPASVAPEARLTPEQCKQTRLDFSGNTLTLSGEGRMARVPIHATGSVPLVFKACDPATVEGGPDALLASAADSTAVGVLTARWPSSGEVFFILTPDAPDSAAVKAFLADPDKVFTQAVEDNHAVANTIQIHTPDPYLNAILPSVLLSYNATWNDPVFCHGAVSWHSEYAGWRNTYGATSAGWHDRVRTHMHAFFGKQSADGRIPSLLGKDEIYNMGEVLVDQALRDWEWTGAIEPLRDGGFDAIARHLAWGEKHMQTPDGLYENFLNAWGTDYKWCNGGGGTIASAYYWRANRTMADIERIAVDGQPATYRVEPGVGHAWLVIEAPGSRKPVRVLVEYGSAALPALETPSSAAPGAAFVVKAARGRITEIRDTTRGLAGASISPEGNQLSARLPAQDGFYTFFAKVEHGDVSLWWPVELDVQADAENPPASDAKLDAVPVKLDDYYNQRLADLHKNTYSPRVKEFPWVLSSGFGITEGTRTVKANGRSWWEGHGKDLSAAADTALLVAAGGRLVSDQGIPFEVPASGKDAVFTSLDDNFPNQIEIPVRMRGRKIHFLLAASISTAQSRMENARITVVLGDGTRRTLSLRDPENIDDWLGSGSGKPYVLSKRVLPLGKHTHAVLNEVDMGEEEDIQSVILATRTNETMVGLLGMTLMRSQK